MAQKRWRRHPKQSTEYCPKRLFQMYTNMLLFYYKNCIIFTWISIWKVLSVATGTSASLFPPVFVLVSAWSCVK